MKKFFISLFILVILLSACAQEAPKIPVSTASTIALPKDEKITESTSDGMFTYDIYKTYAEVTGYLADASDVIVPAAINGVPVLSIGKNSFSYLTHVTKVTLPYTITNIANYSFVGCENLESINFPEGLISIGTYAFRRTKLNSVVFPESLTNIGKYAFGETLIKTIKIPDNIVKMGDYVFYGCIYLESFEIPPVLTVIPKRMFYSCPSLREVVIPDFVTHIDDYAFSTCENLERIYIPATVTKIGEGAFYNCPNLTIVTPSGSAAEKYAINYKINYIKE